MGNILSGALTDQVSTSREDLPRESEAMNNRKDFNDSSGSDNTEEQFHDTISDDEESRARAKEEEMIEFRKQLNLKREQRREILARHKLDKKSLEESLKEERKIKLKLYEENRQLRELLVNNNISISENLPEAEENALFKEALAQLSTEIELQKANNNRLRCDLANSNKALQAAYSEMADLSAQNSESMKQIQALKEVITVSKTMISLREDQLTELKNKLAEIEQSLADREASMLSTDLRQEYERQLQNIRTLRGLYEERARLAEVTRQALARDLEEQKALYEAENSKCNNLTDELESTKATVTRLEEDVEEKNNEIFACKEEMNGIKAEMAVVNKLFSQVLLGYKTKRDLDKLVQRLEENHGILTHMAENENDSEASSALPKLLLEIVNQVDDNSKESNETKWGPSPIGQLEDNVEEKHNKAEEIVQKLPKVWRVLIELLSHQSESNPNESEKVTTCYKSVETKSGPVLVPSVSQTYIRLKDLIIEKLSLVKEVNRMKQLNSHLENRLHEQERRLCSVTTELSKTWHVVGRLRRHHHQLHTHEKILKYELQQKRKLLNELKEELEYCREKWEQAREKNTQSEKDWKKLRAEFSSRKLKDSFAINNSAESGYSDEKVSDESSESNNESDYIPESKTKSRKKLKKSYEAAVDSSTDVNLAERDDPVSDMIDVADLSLDTQDESQDVLDDSCCSENLLKSDKLCDETEDEAVDIGNDEYSIGETTQIKSTVIAKTFDNIPDDPQDNALGHSKLNIASGSQSLFVHDNTLGGINEQEGKQKQSLESEICKAKESLQVSNELDNDKTMSSFVSSNTIKTGGQINDSKTNTPTIPINCNAVVKEFDENVPSTSKENMNLITAEDSTERSVTPDNKFKEILKNIQKQNEHLQRKDKKFEKLESECSEIVSSISSAISKGQVLKEKLNNLHDKFSSDLHEEAALEQKSNTEINLIEPMTSETQMAIIQNESPNSTQILNEDTHVTDNEEKSVVVTDDSSLADVKLDEQNIEANQEASTSSDIDHEARFAARDERLKRLEEQTKSLVNKVNKTATKGVKINYKLEELHQIYGSDHSRSGTPSEDTGDNSQSNDDERENENK